MELYILSNTVKHRFGDSFGRGTRLSLVGARGERVAFQAILPKPFHNAFAEADGEWDAEIFWERYVKLSASSSGLTTAGEYPDVMVDASRAEKFKDNTSERGEGVLWCFVTIPADAAGRHTVRLEVTADEGKAAVEAEIEVLDFCLPEQNGNVTSFAIREDMIKSADPGEFRKKYDELVEEHLHYRLSPTKLLPYGTWGIEEALSEARKRTADVRCAAYSLPYKTFREDTIYEKEQECLDTDYLRKLLTAFAENSTDECDLLKKANFYITFIDEPAPERFHSVRRVYREIHDLKREVAKSVDFTGRRGVENSLLTLDNIVTVFNKEPIYGEVDTWCRRIGDILSPNTSMRKKAPRVGKKELVVRVRGAQNAFSQSAYGQPHARQPLRKLAEVFVRYFGQSVLGDQPYEKIRRKSPGIYRLRRFEGNASLSGRLWGRTALLYGDKIRRAASVASAVQPVSRFAGIRIFYAYRTRRP